MKTLIVYGSKYGTAGECANTLAKKLKGEVQVEKLGKKSPSIDDFDCVIIGSSIYVGNIRKEVKEFCKVNQEKLKSKKLGLFVCGMQDGKQGELQLDLAYPFEFRDHAISLESFGAQLLFSKMNFLERFIIKQIAKNDKGLGTIDGKTDIDKINLSNISKMAEAMNT